jgi:oxygen-dependent protoporphyrinogen oxidase
VSVAAQVGARLGAEVVDRLVDPLLGGVYAGRSDQLSFEATLPALAEESVRHRSMAVAVAAVLDRGTAAAQTPVFSTLAGGLGTLPEVLARSGGAVVRTAATVRELARTEDGWRLTVGSAHAPERIDADAVVLAVPAGPASRLLAGLGGPAAGAAAALAEISYASMAIVTLAYPASAFPQPISGSGYLVPAVDGRPVKAVTFSTVKWPHLSQAVSGHGSGGRDGADMLHVVRCSIGRIGEVAVLQRDDGELAALAAADLAAATGVTGSPADWRVTRWGGGLPQYAVGHAGRVRRIREQVAALPGLAVCGAAYDGVGIPACIASARLAAEAMLAHLRARATAGRPA